VACLWFAHLFVVVDRWPKDLFVTFINLRFPCTFVEDNGGIFAKKERKTEEAK
jgi:hypothetical protein